MCNVMILACTVSTRSQVFLNRGSESRRAKKETKQKSFKRIYTVSFETIRLISQGGGGQGQKDNELRAWKRIPETTRLRNEILIMRFIRSLLNPRSNAAFRGAGISDNFEYRARCLLTHRALESYSSSFGYSCISFFFFF